MSHKAAKFYKCIVTVTESSRASSTRLAAMFSPLPQWRVAERYATAVACAVLAILLRILLEPVLGHASFYVTVYIAVLYAALVCGLGPSILTAIAATAGIVYWFVDPRKSFLISDRRDVHSLIACIVVCPILIALGETNRRKQLKIAEARDQLETRVQERTAELSRALRERELAQEQLRRLSVRLMTVQDEERRKIARGLHDSLGQYLTALKLSLHLLSDDKHAAVVAECSDMVDRCLRETRTISHLLHPPLLDETGLKSAVQWCVDGFAKRSGINVNLHLLSEVQRFHQDVETALFRVVQEALTNVHRHSNASEVNIRLDVNTKQVQLEIRDNGSGIPPDRLQCVAQSGGATGVGLAGMRERVRDLGGDLAIESDKNGTLLKVVIPTAEAAPEKTAKGDTVQSVSAA
jgi:signal transduction histidine kinase